MSLDHKNEYQVFGIPGGGKTTYLSKMIANAARHSGGKNVIVSSFTKAAAEELSGRDLPIPTKNVGTLHSLCYRGIGCPEIAELHIKDFNKESDVQLSQPKDVDVDNAKEEIPSQKTDWDKVFAEYQLNRSKLVPRDRWSPNCEYLAKAWGDWKTENDLCDFTDMIERAQYEMLYPPQNATIGIFDEAQDFTPLQLKLIRQWAMQLNYIMIGGDDDQAIYGFAGADPAIFLNPNVSIERKTYLNRSYRVPRVVQEYARQWIEKIKRREPKEQHPKQIDGEEVEGKLSRVNADFNSPKLLVDRLEQDLAHMSKDKTIMILGACSYMLAPTVNELRSRGIPFGNKYRKKNGRWNPLHPKSGVSTSTRLMSFVDPQGPYWERMGIKFWTMKQLHQWIDLVQAKDLLLNGAKKKIKEYAKAENELTEDQIIDIMISEIFIPDKLEQAVKCDTKWFYDHCLETKMPKIEFPYKILDKQGKEGLTKEPQIIVGTIHSVKGGQADKVYLFPDISMQASLNACTGSEGKESIIRQFYVGMTRCKEELAITNPAGRFFIPI